MSDGDIPTTLCGTCDVEPDVPVRAEVDGQAYAVYEVEGQYFVTRDLCTHGPGNLSDGFVMIDPAKGHADA